MAQPKLSEPGKAMRLARSAFLEGAAARQHVAGGAAGSVEIALFLVWNPAGITGALSLPLLALGGGQPISGQCFGFTLLAGTFPPCLSLPSAGTGSVRHREVKGNPPQPSPHGPAVQIKAPQSALPVGSASRARGCGSPQACDALAEHKACPALACPSGHHLLQKRQIHTKAPPGGDTLSTSSSSNAARGPDTLPSTGESSPQGGHATASSGSREGL